MSAGQQKEWCSVIPSPWLPPVSSEALQVKAIDLTSTLGTGMIDFGNTASTIWACKDVCSMFLS